LHAFINYWSRAAILACFEMRILIVDDNSQIAVGLKSKLAQHFRGSEIIIVGTVADAINVIDTSQKEIRLVLLDLILPDSSGTSLLVHLAGKGLNGITDAIVVSGAADGITVDRCRSLGARGFVAKAWAEALIVQAIDAVLRGSDFFEESYALGSPSTQDANPLSERQAKVASLLASGKSNKEISDVLAVQPSLVKNILFELMRFYEVSSRSDLVAKLEQTDGRGA
jgi:DNA-binding NarL/FixJ family response regulator